MLCTRFPVCEHVSGVNVNLEITDFVSRKELINCCGVHDSVSVFSHKLQEKFNLVCQRKKTGKFKFILWVRIVCRVYQVSSVINVIYFSMKRRTKLVWFICQSCLCSISVNQFSWKCKSFIFTAKKGTRQFIWILSIDFERVCLPFLLNSLIFNVHRNSLGSFIPSLCCRQLHSSFKVNWVFFVVVVCLHLVFAGVTIDQPNCRDSTRMRVQLFKLQFSCSSFLFCVPSTMAYTRPNLCHLHCVCVMCV